MQALVGAVHTGVKFVSRVWPGVVGAVKNEMRRAISRPTRQSAAHIAK